MNRRFEALDAFRGICAISVVIFHMHFVNSITELDFFRGSALFVQFFFVLSGFVLANGYSTKENMSFKTFMKARFYRIYPLHICMLIVFIVFETCKFIAYKFVGISFNGIPFTNSTAITEILPNLLLIQSWSHFTNPLSFNYPSWSISIEFYMYALLCLTIIICKSKKNLAWLYISFIAFLLIYFKSAILVNTVLKGLFCFFSGALTYSFFKKISHLRLSFEFATVIEALILFSIILVISSDSVNRYLIAPLLFIFTVLFFSFEAGLISKILKIKLFQTAGKLSYSIYMTHAAILFFLTSIGLVLQKVTGENIAPMINSQRYLDFGGGLVNNTFILLTLTLIIYTSKVTYNIVELKGIRLNSKAKSDMKK